jgi:hypothetical protein
MEQLAAASAAVEAAQAALADVDPELDAANWHAARAERDEQLVAAIRERERLTASVEHHRLKCLAIVRGIAAVPIGEAEARSAARRDRLAALEAERATLIREQAADTDRLDDLRHEAEQAEIPYVDSSMREWYRGAERRGREAAEQVRKARKLGFNPVVLPEARRHLRTPEPTPEELERAAREHARATYPHEGAIAAGISRFEGDGVARLG